MLTKGRKKSSKGGKKEEIKEGKNDRRDKNNEDVYFDASQYQKTLRI